MSSKSSVYFFVIVGLLIGAGAGYFIANSRITSISAEHTLQQSQLRNELEDQMSQITAQLEKSQTQLTESESDYYSLDERLLKLLADYENLLSDYDVTSESYDQLLSDYDDLFIDYEEKSVSYDQLLYNYEATSESYDQLLSDYEHILGAVPLQPEPPSTEVIEKVYTWLFDGRTWTLSLNIPESIYEYYAELERPPTQDYSIYVTHPFDDEYLRILIEKINFIAISRDCTETEKVNLVISFVQSLPYTSDSVTTPYDEYPRYPLETLVDGGGDCEDSSILVSSLLHGMNYDVILLGLPGHMACGVYTQDGYGSYFRLNDREYFYLETTSEGWEIGEVPERYQGESAYLYELTATPILTQFWSASWIGEDLEIDVTVSNLGTALAQDIKVYASLDAGEGYVWSPIETESFDLEFGREITLSVIVEVPKNEHTRLIIGILDSEGYSIDRSYSEWFDT